MTPEPYLLRAVPYTDEWTCREWVWDWDNWVHLEPSPESWALQRKEIRKMRRMQREVCRCHARCVLPYYPKANG
jgi:hypothetical protein